MQDQNGHRTTGAPHAMLLMSVCCAALAALFSSCSTGLPLQREAQQAEESVGATRFFIVCVIHGDGDYQYHDTSGNAYEANEKALARAQKVAEQNPQAEVFIFHQKPRRHFLFSFPLSDGEFYCYRNGRLIATESYWRDQKESLFEPELELYRRFGTGNQREMIRLFLYYGHEIPEFGGAGYDASYPDRPFTVGHLANGLEGFTGDSARFDLMVLSACFGGTPYTIGSLGPFARYIIASPDNLHLSYFDFHSLEHLELSIRDRDVSGFAKQFARRAFDRLTGDVQTAVSVAVYDVDRVQEYVDSVHSVYDRTLTTLRREIQVSMSRIKHCDCADLPPYVLPSMNKGVEVFYRPARFGRSQYKQSHSGWECWTDSGSQAPPVRAAEPVSP